MSQPIRNFYVSLKMALYVGCVFYLTVCLIYTVAVIGFFKINFNILKNVIFCWSVLNLVNSICAKNVPNLLKRSVYPAGYQKNAGYPVLRLLICFSILMDLVNPGKKPKEVIEEKGDEDIDTGDSKGDDDVKVSCVL